MKTTQLQLTKLCIVIFLAMHMVQTFAQTLPGSYTGSWLGNTFGGAYVDGDTWPKATNPNDKWIQDYIDCMTVEADGTCYTESGWDEAGRTHGVYKDGDVLGNVDNNINCGSAGGYTISGTTITGNGKTISNAGSPTAIAMGRGSYAGKLLVADNGARKQILVYDVSGTPTIVETIGTNGGIASSFSINYNLPASINAPAYASGTYGPGFYHPLKLWGLTGVGCDDLGRIFVSHSEMGSGIRCFKKVNGNWQLDWRVENYFFVDNVYYDEKTDAVDVYGVQEHFKMNFNTTTPGGEWSIYGYSLDKYTYPQDPRGIEEIKAGGEHGLTGTVMRDINGTRYIWTSGMTCQPPNIFKYKPGTEVAVPCGLFMQRDHRIYDLPITFWWPPQRPSTTNSNTMFWEDLNNNGQYEANEYTDQTHDFGGGDFFVDKSGNIWQGQNPITVWNASILANGNIHYSSSNLTTYNISGIPSIGKIVYQEDKNRLVLLTTACRNLDGGKVYVVNNWSSGNRAATYVSDLKLPKTTADDISSWSAAGDYAFEVGWGTRAKVWVTDLNTGALVGTMEPGAALGYLEHTGWVDIAAGLQAYKRNNGEYLVFVEDDYLSRVVLYRWCPTGTCSESTVGVTSVSVSPTTASVAVNATSQLTATVAPSNATNKNVTWTTSSSTVATVSTTGLVTGKAAGTATITVTTVDGSKTANCAITVTASTGGSWTIIDDAATGWTWNGFTNDPCSTCYNGTSHSANVKNKTASYTFTGTDVEAYCETWNGAGSVKIYIDNVLKGTYTQNITPYGGAQKFATITGLTNAPHTIKFITTSTRSVGIDYIQFMVNTAKSGWVETGIENAQDNAIMIYPNPVTNVLHITNADYNADISIYSMDGKLVSKLKSNGAELVIDVAGWNKGMYIMSINSNNQNMVTKLVVK